MTAPLTLPGCRGRRDRRHRRRAGRRLARAQVGDRGPSARRRASPSSAGRPGQARRDARRARGQGLPRGLAHLAVRVGGCARGGTAGVRVGQGRHRRHLRLAHPLVLPVGRFRLQPELHRRRAGVRFSRRPRAPRSLVGIVDQGSQIVGSDIWALLWLLGGINLILALFNLIPLLPFDGGHAAIVVYEWARIEDQGSQGRGRLQEADSGHGHRARVLPHAEPVGDVPRRPAGHRPVTAPRASPTPGARPARSTWAGSPSVVMRRSRCSR